MSGVLPYPRDVNIDVKDTPAGWTWTFHLVPTDDFPDDGAGPRAGQSAEPTKQAAEDAARVAARQHAAVERMRAWAYGYADEIARMSDGRYDRHFELDNAYELYRGEDGHRDRDPAEVARERW